MWVVMITVQYLSRLIPSDKNMGNFCLLIIFAHYILMVNGSEEFSNATNIAFFEEVQWNVTISIDLSDESRVSSGYLLSNVNEDYYNFNNKTLETTSLSVRNVSTEISTKSDNNTNTKILSSASREIYVILEFAFMFLAFTIIVCMIRTSFRKQSMKRYSFIIDFFLTSIAVSRSLFIFLQQPTSGIPIDTTSTLQLTLFNLPFPSLLASFTVVFFSVLRLTKLNLFHSPKQTSFILLVIIVIQFFSVLLLDTFLHYFSSGNQIPIGELIFSLWFWLFSVIFFYYFRQLRFESLRKQNEIMRFTFTKLHIEGGRLPPKLPYSPLKLVIGLIFTSVVLTLTLTFLLICNVIMKLRICNDLFSLKIRFIVILISRLLEIIISFILLYVTMQPLDTVITKSVFNAFSNCTCGDICGDKTSLTDDIYPTYCTNNSAVARTHFTFEHWNTKNQQAIINCASLNVKSMNENMNRNYPPIIGARRNVTLSSLATLSNVHSHFPTKLCIENKNYSNLELNAGPHKSPTRNLFNSIMLKRCGSSDSSGFDVHFPRKSPITKTEELSRRRSGGSTPAKDYRKIPNLNLTSINSTKPLQDITPDSAVDLEFPSDVIIFSQLPLSHSMNDLQGFQSKHKGLSHSLLNRFRSSTFSLSSHNGYEQFDSPQPNFRRNWEMKTAFRGSNASSKVSREIHDDFNSDLSSHISCLCGELNSVKCVSTEVQTEPFDFLHQVVVHSNCEA